jgi:hypothetical protein
MTISDWIAGYAAIVATTAVAWQAFTYWSARRPKLSLKFEPILFAMSTQGQRSLFDVLQGKESDAAGITWLFYVR